MPAVPVALIAVVALIAAGLFYWLGPAAIVLVIGCALLALLLWAVVSMWLWLRAEQQRRAARYVICEADYEDAPRQIKSSMRRIYRSARAVRAGHAYQGDMFGELGLDHLVYSAAERAVLSSELAAAVRDLRPDAKRSDHSLLHDADAQVASIKDELASVEAMFKRSATTADNLSERITEPERRRAAQVAEEEAATAADDRRRQALRRLEDVSTRANAGTDLEHSQVEDRIAAVAAGYDDITEVSDRILGDVSVNVPAPNGDDGSPPSSRTRDSAVRAAKFTAGKTAKWSASAAKAGTEKIKNRDRRQPPQS